MAGNDSFTKLLLHCDGADASTTFTDASLAAHGNATVAGNAQVDTGQSKFGGASLLLDGSGDYLTYASHADWAFGSGNFTLDFWVRPNAILTGLRGLIGRQAVGAGSFPPFLVITSGMDVLFYMSSNGTSFDITANQSLGTLAADTWAHLAVTRSGSDIRTFKDGSLIATASNAGVAIDNSQTLVIGEYNSGTFNGWMEEIRVSKGVARWTAGFTPPTAAYSQAVAQAISAGVDGAASVARATSKAVSAGVDGAVAVTRAVAHSITAGIEVASATFKNAGKVVAAAIDASVSIIGQKTRVVVISIGVDASVSIRRAITFTIRPALDLLASVTWRLRPDNIIASIRGGSGRASISAGSGRATISAGGGRAIIRRR